MIRGTVISFETTSDEFGVSLLGPRKDRMLIKAGKGERSTG